MELLLTSLIIFAPSLIFFSWFFWSYFKRGLRLTVVYGWHCSDLEDDDYKVPISVGSLIFLVVMHSLPIVNYCNLVVDIFFILKSKLSFLNKPIK